MLIAIIFGVFLGSSIQMQNQYDVCKKMDFKTEACSYSKKLHSYKK